MNFVSNLVKNLSSKLSPLVGPSRIPRGSEAAWYLLINLVIPYAAKWLIFPYIPIYSSIALFFALSATLIYANIRRAIAQPTYRIFYAITCVLNTFTTIILGNLTVFTAIASIWLLIRVIIGVAH